jgi:hypothetical protein
MNSVSGWVSALPERAEFRRIVEPACHLHWSRWVALSGSSAAAARPAPRRTRRAVRRPAAATPPHSRRRPEGVADQLLQLAGWRADLPGDVLQQQPPGQVPPPPPAPLRPAEEPCEAGVERLQLWQQRGQVLAVTDPGRTLGAGMVVILHGHPEKTATVTGSQGKLRSPPGSVDNRRCRISQPGC